ncbi:CdaR family transcriptional regulator [Mycolicibacterium litorale]|uniref:CdaR family transcriptional regulator n=1 Tax=Mycolicibacterium litorale TaxID=758802 RepID=A0AAD1MTS4_9MYCO|nr:sugar diacid recognition domain-containing protein [Mycolicibacterium litorale]MCV7415273.1 helix-turn-helix domain-containing protein [Mycolicibacterium litorale]BBY16453.1 CdaR family transcriptional regulator [Mycolicibacterium litorale]
MLGKALAQQIADDITDVIGRNVLITDERAIVLGSGDESRVGQFHEASVEVIRSRRTIAHSAEDVRDLVGTLPGVTIPLVTDDRVVGTIGLSGPPAEVEQFGLLVKRQTEILMQEAARIGLRMTRERATTELLAEICEWHQSRVPTARLLQRGRTLGHDLTLPRRIVLIQWDDREAGPREIGSEDISRVAVRVFDSDRDLIAPLSRTVVAVATPDDSSMRPLHDRCAELVTVAADSGMPLRAAIGSPAAGIAALNISARDAYDAMHVGPSAQPDQRIHRIDEVRLHQALSVVPIDSRLRLTEGLLGPLLADRDWAVLRDTLIAWGDCAFNVTRAAERLHVHRNTLIYRLDKVGRTLDRTLSEPGLAVAVYVTCVLDRLG